MASALLASRIALAIAAALLLLGVATALRASNAMKRLAGVLIAQLAAIFALGGLHAPAQALIAGIVAMTMTLFVGAALIVRLQEAYGGVERGDLDMADAMNEPAEPGA